MLLLAGGDHDPQMIRLLKQAAKQGIQVDALLTGQSGTPCVCWDIKNRQLTDGKQVLQPQAAFIRQDVFSYLQTNKPQDQAIAREWFVTIAGWLLANPDVRVFNRAFLEKGPVNKPYMLYLAAQHGLSITDTVVTNDGLFLEALASSKKWIQKPVSGGAHCEALKQENRQSALSYPQIIQNKLHSPELRVFRIGDSWFGFQIITDALDYRTSPNTRIRSVAVPEDIRTKMQTLCDSLALNFAAADFKTDENTGQLSFLEINTNPMFAGFDQYANGQLCKAMLDWLLPVAQQPAITDAKTAQQQAVYQEEANPTREAEVVKNANAARNDTKTQTNEDPDEFASGHSVQVEESEET